MPRSKKSKDIRRGINSSFSDVAVDGDTTPNSPGLSHLQLILADKPQATGSDLFIQPMQSVALSPKNGMVTKRMMLSWLYFLKNIQDMEPATTYRFRMAPLMEFLETKEYEDVKDDLRGLNATQVEWNNYRDDETSWGVSTLLSQVEIKGSKSGNFIEISLPPKIESGIRERKAYSELNLLLARQLRSTAALNLYRICVAYETNPSGVTFRAPPEHWYPKLAGNPMPDGSKFEYKYFKRDTLRPAIAEINTLSDILVDLVEHHEGKRVKEIQFSVEPKPQAQLQLIDGNSEETQTLTELIELGVRRNIALSLLRDFGVERIMRNIKYTKDRHKTMGDAMRNPVLYLKKAIRDDYASELVPEPNFSDNAAINASKIEAKRAEKEKKLRLSFDTHRRKEAAALFTEMSLEQSDAKWNGYKVFLSESGNNLLLKQAEKKGLAAKAVEVDFLNWFAVETWGEPTEKDLLTFLLHSSQ